MLTAHMNHQIESEGNFDQEIDEILYSQDHQILSELECHFCKSQLHENNNVMTRCMSNQELAPRGMGWVSVIVQPFREVPCCDICLEKPDDQLQGLLMV